jgi:hypothetical protein
MSSRFASGHVMAYGAPSMPDDMWPLPLERPLTPRVAPIGPPILAPAYTPEQIVSLLMQRLQPALDELHARLDKIERRLPLDDAERKQLDAIRTALGAKP